MNKDIKPYLAIGVIVLGFGYFYLTFLMGKQPNDQVLIAIVSSVATILGYYFGSSTGAAKKDETINNLTQQNKMSYTVASISQTEAEELAKNSKEAYKCKSEYFTYTDVMPDAPTLSITEDDNDNCYIITWNGTTPVFTKRKMFPR